MLVLFRHPDGCRWLWQARYNVYFSLFALESSGSHATLSHLKEKQQIISPSLKQQTGWEVGGAGYICLKYDFSMVDWYGVTPTGPRVSTYTQDKQINILWSHRYITLITYLTLFIMYFLRECTDWITFFLSSTWKTNLFCSFYRNRIVMVHPLLIACSQMGALHISPARSPEYHDSCWRCEGRRW